jgi:hypothetical protein
MIDHVCSSENLLFYLVYVDDLNIIGHI